MKKLWKTLLGVAAGAAVILLGYSVYVFAAYDRLEDRLPLTVENARQAEAETEKVYTAVSYNLGFGAYSAGYSFFMDGGTESRAYSAEAVRENIGGAMDAVSNLKPDFLLLQEVDQDATRSYHVDEVSMAAELMPEKTWVYAQNYDSPYLFWPVTEPHGASRSGIVTMSAYCVDSALRRSLPVAENISCILDLDRCYSVSRVPVDNGKELVIYALHMSAYGNSDAIREGQIQMLCQDMKTEYEAGNYIICGGDFNHDLKADEGENDSYESWAYPFPRSELPEHFSFAMDSLSEQEKDALWNSARNADMEYEEGVTYTVTLDGFIISDNVECVSYENINTGYTWSDHDPVYLKFRLNR